MLYKGKDNKLWLVQRYRQHRVIRDLHPPFVGYCSILATHVFTNPKDMFLELVWAAHWWRCWPSWFPKLFQGDQGHESSFSIFKLQINRKRKGTKMYHSSWILPNLDSDAKLSSAEIKRISIANQEVQTHSNATLPWSITNQIVYKKSRRCLWQLCDVKKQLP